jgi:hypothetical protein
VMKLDRLAFACSVHVAVGCSRSEFHRVDLALQNTIWLARTENPGR